MEQNLMLWLNKLKTKFNSKKSKKRTRHHNKKKVFFKTSYSKEFSNSLNSTILYRMKISHKNKIMMLNLISFFKDYYSKLWG